MSEATPVINPGRKARPGDAYRLRPYEHIQRAERYADEGAEILTGDRNFDPAAAAAYAALAQAHCAIAQAQMVGGGRA